MRSHIDVLVGIWICFVLPQLPATLQDLKLVPGTPCKNLNGYCDVFAVCRLVNEEGPLLQFKQQFLTGAGTEKKLPSILFVVVVEFYLHCQTATVWTCGNWAEWSRSSRACISKIWISMTETLWFYSCFFGRYQRSATLWHVTQLINWFLFYLQNYCIL